MPLQIGNTTVTCLSSNSGNFQQQQQQLSRLVQGSGSSGGVGRMLDEVVDVDELASRQQGQGQTASSGGGGGGSAGGGGGGSGGGFSGGFTVKQERHDDQEINELAAKILETNKAFIAKTAQQQQLLQQQQQRQQQNSNGGTAANGPNNGNQNIMNYFPRKTNGTQNGTMTNGNNSAGGISGGGNSAGSRMNNGECLSPSGASEQSNGEKKPCDDESVMGHFGWHTFNKSIHIPYILRAQEKYCAVRIAEMKLLNKYLNYLHQDIYNCTCVRSYYITEAESRLLNDINIKHCDGQFGRPLFTHKDLVVRLTDVTKFWTFLDVCYRKLSSGNSGGHSEKCGFIRINKESVVPYTVRDNQKFVPLFYFEGETENLKLKADYLSGWDLSYLKFCCKVQGIRNELFASDQVAVISLTDIKSYFPPGTEFEDYWPSKMVDSQLLVGKNGSHAANNVHWTRQPAAPPSKPTTTVNQPVSNPVTNTAPTRSKQTANPYNNMTAAAPVQQQTASQINQVASNIANMPARLNAAVAHINAQMLSQQQEQYMRLAGSRLRGGESQIQNILQGQYNMLRAIGTNGAQAPPPLVRAANGQTNANAHHMSASLQQQQQQQLQQFQMQQYQQQQLLQQQQQQQQQQQSSQRASRSTAHQQQLHLAQQQMLSQQDALGACLDSGMIPGLSAAYVTRNGMMPAVNPNLINNGPFKLQTTNVDGITVPCINMKPNYSEQWMRLQDLKDNFFPQTTLDNCRRVLEVFSVVVMKANRQQVKVFLESSVRNTYSDNMELVKVTDVKNYMPQLKYIIKSQLQEQPPNKRTRIS